jgi:hypothetical protein
MIELFRASPADISAGLVVHTSGRLFLIYSHNLLARHSFVLILIAELAAKRGLRTWPRGARWPVQVQTPEDKPSRTTNVPPPVSSTDPAAEAANLKLAQTQESELAQQTDKQVESEGRGIPEREHSYLNIFATATIDAHILSWS